MSDRLTEAVSKLADMKTAIRRCKVSMEGHPCSCVREHFLDCPPTVARNSSSCEGFTISGCPAAENDAGRWWRATM